MRLLFEKLFEVNLLHNYYNSGVSQDFQIVPAQDCLRHLRNYGLRFRSTSAGFSVYYEAQKDSDDNSHPVRPIEEQTKFSFILIPKNSYLLNYSELSFDGHDGTIYWLHNLNDNEQNGVLLLTSDSNSEYISAPDRLQLRPQLFTYRFESTTSKEVAMVDELGAVISQKSLSPNEGFIDYPLDLTGRKPGKFALTVDGNDELEFYADSNIAGMSAFGAVELFVGTNVPSSYRFVDENGDASFKSFTIKLDNRKTFWKYLVHLKHRTDISAAQLSIQSSHSFTVGNEFTLSDGTKVVPFVSDQPIPLHSMPIKDIKLVRTNGSALETFEIRNLPNAAIHGLDIDAAANKIYSEVFVYV